MQGKHHDRFSALLSHLSLWCYWALQVLCLVVFIYLDMHILLNRKTIGSLSFVFMPFLFFLWFLTFKWLLEVLNLCSAWHMDLNRASIVYNHQSTAWCITLCIYYNVHSMTCWEIWSYFFISCFVLANCALFGNWNPFINVVWLILSFPFLMVSSIF